MQIGKYFCVYKNTISYKIGLNCTMKNEEEKKLFVKGFYRGELLWNRDLFWSLYFLIIIIFVQIPAFQPVTLFTQWTNIITRRRAKLTVFLTNLNDFAKTSLIAAFAELPYVKIYSRTIFFFFTFCMFSTWFAVQTW